MTDMIRIDELEEKKEQCKKKFNLLVEMIEGICGYLNYLRDINEEEDKVILNTDIYATHQACKFGTEMDKLERQIKRERKIRLSKLKLVRRPKKQ